MTPPPTSDLIPCQILSRSDYISPSVQFEVHNGTEYALYAEHPDHFNDDENYVDYVISQGIDGADPNGRTRFFVPTVTFVINPNDHVESPPVYIACEPKEMYLKNRFEGLHLIDNTADTEAPFVIYHEGDEISTDAQKSIIRSCKEGIIAKGVAGTDFHLMADITSP